MGKSRTVKTSFWSDNYIIELDPIDKLLFLYLLTNEKTNMLGIYELHIRKISFDTGIDKERIAKGFESFAKDKKALYVDGYVILRNFTKHQKYNTNMKKSALNDFNKLPLEVRKHRFCKPLLKGIEPFPKGFEPFAKIESESEVESEREIESEIEKVICPESDDSDEYPDVCEFLDESRELANHLLQRIIEWKPDHKYAKNKPSLNRWILDIERMVRLDGRNPKNIKSVIDYTFTKDTKQAQFWAKNIWSGDKLREKYDRLVSDYKTETNGTNNSTVRETKGDRRIRQLKEHQ